MRCDELHNRSHKIERRQAVLIAGRAAPELARHLAAILSSAEGGLSHLERPDPDLAQIRNLLGEIALAGRRAAFAAGQKPLAGEPRTFGRPRPGAASHATPSRPVLSARTGDAAPQAREAPVSAPSSTVHKALDGESSEAHILKGGLARWQQKQALSLMSRLDLEAPKISDVASACRLSRGYFIKAFKQSFGLTPRRWHQLYRIEQSKQLLLTHDLPIAEIALTCGFADQSHLTRVFNQIVGMPPARWRRQRSG